MLENNKQALEENDENIDNNGQFMCDPEKEKTYFPWSIVIISGVLIVLMIACFIAIKLLEA